jgi:hypothetical protein
MTHVTPKNAGAATMSSAAKERAVGRMAPNMSSGLVERHSGTPGALSQAKASRVLFATMLPRERSDS